MTKEWLQKQADALHLDKGLEAQDIPDIDLYMDQLITLFENKLSHTKRYEDDKLLTKTMINNYTKDKVIMPALKKKYTKEHIMLMILLYHAKNIVSISDIKELFSVVKEGDEIDSQKLHKLFTIYQNCKEKETKSFIHRVDDTVDQISKQMAHEHIEDDSIEIAVTVLMLLEQANASRRLAEKLIDEYISKTGEL